MSEAAVLTVRGLGKSYAAPVLKDVDLTLPAGEVHALMGANGAGKSTFARIVSGLVTPDTGSMELDAHPYAPPGKRAASARGVQIVQQELNLLGTLSVSENLFLDRLPHRLGTIDRRKLRDQARQALALIGLDQLDPDRPVSELGIGEQQLVEIAGALARPCRFLILDEPTAALNETQAALLFRQIARLKREGVAILYISHRLDEIRQIADRISVLRDGALVATRPAAELGMGQAVVLMIGASLADEVDRPARSRGRIALRIQNLSRGDRVRDISLDVHHGEVLGLAGLVGAGRTELLRTLYGADPAASGTIRLDERPASPPFRTPHAAVRAGLGLVPEDRKAEGLLLPAPVRVNLSLARLGAFGRALGRLDRRAEVAASQSISREIQLKADSIEQPVEQLSGGNQQKVVLGRWLMRQPEIILLDEPTRGIDVGARQAIHALIDQLARDGKAILMVSSEVEELMAVCDRIAVLSAGRLVATFERGGWTHEAILAAAFTHHTGPESLTSGATLA